MNKVLMLECTLDLLYKHSIRLPSKYLNSSEI